MHGTPIVLNSINTKTPTACCTGSSLVSIVSTMYVFPPMTVPLSAANSPPSKSHAGPTSVPQGIAMNGFVLFSFAVCASHSCKDGSGGAKFSRGGFPNKLSHQLFVPHNQPSPEVSFVVAGEFPAYRPKSVSPARKPAGSTLIQTVARGSYQRWPNLMRPVLGSPMPPEKFCR